jgi:DNA-binding CsgD family transcriptional regulator
MCPISFNAEAIEILSFPDKLANGNRPDVALMRRIRSILMSQQPSRESPFVTEFRSGRRRYLCRAFPVDLHPKGPVHTSTAVLLVRASSGSILSLQVPERFHFTRREGETLGFLLQGLSNKEIANRMNVSPNTIKVFLRLIMVKMGVRSRAAIVVKLL